MISIVSVCDVVTPAIGMHVGVFRVVELSGEFVVGRDVLVVSGMQSMGG